MRYNGVLTPAEYSALLSNFADYLHNNYSYPTTRFGEAVIHSAEYPDVIMYVKGDIGNPQITKIVLITADKSDISTIKEWILENEYKQISQPYSAVENYYGQEVLDINRQRDFTSFRQYQSEQERGGSPTGYSVSGAEQDRAGGFTEGQGAYNSTADAVTGQSADTGGTDTATSPMGNLKFFMSSVQNGTLIEQAEAMEQKSIAEGKDEILTALEIWDTFHIVRDLAGVWVTEINDWNIKIFPDGDAIDIKRTEGELDDYVVLDVLFERYPELKDIKVRFEDIDGEGGHYSYSEKEIVIGERYRNNIDALTYIFIHEIQHAIQHIDGREAGSNSVFWLNKMVFEGIDTLPQKKGVADGAIEAAQKELNQLLSRATPKAKTDLEAFRQALEENDEKTAMNILWDMSYKKRYAQIFPPMAYRVIELQYMEKGITIYPPDKAYMYSAGEIESRLAEQRYKQGHDDALTIMLERAINGERFNDPEKVFAELSAERPLPEYRDNKDNVIFASEYLYKPVPADKNVDYNLSNNYNIDNKLFSNGEHKDILTQLNNGLITAEQADELLFPDTNAENFGDKQHSNEIDNFGGENSTEQILDAFVAGIENKEIPQSQKKPIQLHHFATNKSKKYTSQFETIVSKYGLNLDGDWNKDIVPHKGRHPYEYHDYILDNMQKFDIIANGDKNKFLKLYEGIKEKIKNNPDMLYKKYWQNNREE